MFEEVPRGRRGLAGLLARPVALGPFVLGSGLALVALGGSVAVAATVITASTRAVNDVPPRRPPSASVQSGANSSSSAATPAVSAAVPVPPAGRTSRSTRSPLAAAPFRGPVHVSVLPSWVAPIRSGSAGSPVASTLASATPPTSSSGPVGNALIYVSGYDRPSRTLVFEYASLVPGAGAGGSDLYRVSAPAQFRAGLAADLSITSGGQLCPPAGSSCSVAELIGEAAKGFFAEAAINPAAEFESIVEVDNAAVDPATSSAGPGNAATSSPQPSASPTS
jgi:hypothetical protein